MNRISILTLLVSLFILQLCSAQTFPEKEWERNLSPTFSGWDAEKLDHLREYIVDSTATTGMMIIQDGKVVFEFGNLSENSYIASCRKSVLAMLFGKYVENGRIDLDKSLEDMGIHKLEPLLESEAQATTRDIISSRSGVFLPASNKGDMRHLAPRRGSVKPGEFWLYNNWDFNMAGYIFEKETNTNIYDEMESQLAIPLQMEDWDRALQQKSGDYKHSDFDAYHIWLSTRDMARIGWLMLNNGTWKDKQLINKDWIKEMVSAKTTFEEADKTAPGMKEVGGFFSYGYMWWLWEKPGNVMLENAYTASGAWGQNITVFPKMNTVLVVKTNDVYERMKGNPNYIIDLVSKSYSPDQAKELKEISNLLDRNIPSFIHNIRRLDRSKFKNIDFQNSLNKLGYLLLEANDFTNAIDIFKLNVDLHPEAWGVYDSLGEAYFFSGKLEKAQENYKRALALNVNNEYNHNSTIREILYRLDYKINYSVND